RRPSRGRERKRDPAGERKPPSASRREAAKSALARRILQFYPLVSTAFDARSFRRDEPGAQGECGLARRLPPDEYGLWNCPRPCWWAGRCGDAQRLPPLRRAVLHSLPGAFSLLAALHSHPVAEAGRMVEVAGKDCRGNLQG